MSSESPNKKGNLAFLTYWVDHFGDIQSVTDLQLQMFRNRLDTLEKQVASKHNSDSTDETIQATQRLNFDDCSERLESIRMKLASQQLETSDPFSFSSVYNQNIKILDFSPEWDYTSGGVKLLI